jgi:pimeloyl-ACP methyl ester carboxylesterase
VHGLAEEVLCGEHEVYEDRRAGIGRRIRIHFSVLPALRRPVQPDPLVVFAGGPGQGARAYAPLIAATFKPVRRTRDVVLIDFRGTGDSHPLECPQKQDELESLNALTGAGSLAEECLAALDADPRHYTHVNALADVDEILQGLGYGRVNLWGGSWGTRSSLLFALTYPQIVRRVVLDGAVPLDMEFPRSAARDAERAFDLLRARCAGEPSCAAAFPDVRASLDVVLRRFQRPAKVTVRHPRTAEKTTVVLTSDLVAELVRASLYSPASASVIPEVLHRAERGDYGPLLAGWFRLSVATVETMALGATLSVLCSEDLPRVARVDFAADARGTFVGSSYADRWRFWCQAWPAGAELAVENGRSSAPALILSGVHDPVTPPRWGARMGRHFPNHLLVDIPAAAHNASFSGCVPELIAAFIERGDQSSELTSSHVAREACLDRITWPPFAVSHAGSRP